MLHKKAQNSHKCLRYPNDINQMELKLNQSNEKTEMNDVSQIDYERKKIQICEKVCEKAFIEKADLEKHSDSELHIEDRASVSKEQFLQTDNLKNHVLIQSNEKTEMNDVCQIDNEDERYTCHVCEKTFKEKADLEKHSKMHTVDQPSVSQEKFPQNLEYYVLIQSNEQTEMNDVSQVDYEGKKYTCDVCEKTFKEKADLEKHNKTHIEDRPNLNHEQFPLIDNLKYYILIQSNENIEMNDVCQVDYEEKKYTCDVCEKTFKEKADLKKHNKMHVDDQPYKCEISSKSFTQSESLKTDLLIHTKEKALVCPEYRKECLQKDRDHHLMHTGKKLYKCAICSKSFINSAILRRHYLKHTRDEQHVCHECQKAFSREDSLSEHLFSHFPSHTKAKPYISSACEKTILVNQNVKQNLLILTREKLHICQICQTPFSSMQNLKNHLLTHKKCIICSKSFVLLEERYLLSYTGEKLYVCSECEKASGEKLTQHFFSHAEEEQYTDDIDHFIYMLENPYRCEMCQEAFGHLDNFQKHLLGHT